MASRGSACPAWLEAPGVGSSLPASPDAALIVAEQAWPVLSRQVPPSEFQPAWNVKTDSLIRVNKRWSSVCVYLPSVLSDVGVKETITPHGV